MTHPLIVLKFGSSILRTALDMPKAVHEIYRWHRAGWRVIAIVSAVGETTELLLRDAGRLADQPQPQATARLLATGELQSAALLGIALDRAGVPARVIDPHEIQLMLRGTPMDSEPVGLGVEHVARLLQLTPVLVIPGFFGYSEDGEVHLLGRGGSDLTAVYLAINLGANRCRLVKDVAGVYDHDPAVGSLPARRFRTLGYTKALQCAAQLVQPKAVHCLEQAGASVEVARLLGADASTIGPVQVTVTDAKDTSPTSVLLLGLGTVGGGVHQRLLELPREFQFAGALIRNRAHHHTSTVTEHQLLDSPLQVLQLRPDVVVDALPGIEPSLTLARHFLQHRVHVVSANKRLIAEHGVELSQLAARHGVSLRYSACVGGGAPMLEALHVDSGAEAQAITGVLNGSCNYILDACINGMPFDDAVRQAQSLGFAEADPQDDLSGRDALCKLRVLARHAFGRELQVLDIEPLTADSIVRHRSALQPQPALRQVARAWRDANLVLGQIRLEAVDAAHALAGVHQEWNRLIITRADGTTTTVSGRGAGRWPTAESVLGDLLAIHLGRLSRSVAVSSELGRAELETVPVLSAAGHRAL
jgi:homoserine dehydrogenase